MDRLSRVQELIKEIQSIIPQFEAEVRGSRKTWPVSVKDRVLELCRLGLGPKKITDLTGIAYMTLLLWRREAGLPVGRNKRQPSEGFHSLTVVPTMVVGTTVVGEPKPSVKSSKITLTFSNDLKVELSNIDDALTILKGLREG